MSLTPGTRLGPYEVTAQIGIGGMGEVYRATDTTLNRQVAVKVLPESLASDAERIARFEREAKTLASLNHPNIAQIYGFEKSSGVHALVMELVEGPTLEDRIAEGAIPVDEALPIAKQIAEAVEAAHEQGIIHRDLKPANVKLRPDGVVKVLDFGLAKALEPTGAMSPGMSQAPTITTPAMTQAGMILGTAAYMSPEQAKGRTVDKRSDVWAFGAVLYEMLTGQRAFAGSDVSEVLASVLAREPDWTLLPVGMSPVLGAYIRRCLHKDSKQRIGDVQSLRLALEGVFETGGLQTAEPAVVQSAVWRRPVPVALAASVLTALVVGLLFGNDTPTTAPGVRRFALDLPWQTMPNWGDFRVRISPSGTHLAYPGSDENRTTIQLRPLGSLDAVTLVGGRANPWQLTFSPDGQRLAFFIGTWLHTVSIQGGEPEPLFETEGRTSELSWGPDGSLLVGGTAGLTRVPTSGGDAELVAAAQDTEWYDDPFHLPGGDHALLRIDRPPNESRLAVADLETGEVRDLAFQGREPIYSPTGHVLYRQAGELFAFPFDLDALEARGEAVSVADGVAWGPRLSDDGTLVYVAQRALGTAGLVWVDRQGAALPIPGERRDYTHLDLSADGAWALLVDGGAIYATDLARRGLVSTGSNFPVWHPDNERAAFYNNDDEAIRRGVADGSEAEETLLQGYRLVPTSWSPDGAYLAFFNNQSDVWMLPTEGDPEPFLTGPANERSARFSPDGSVVAYVSDESGEYQVYVVPFPGPGGRTPVSIDGGLSPVWSADGSELYFRQGSKVVGAKIALTPEIEVSPPELLFDGPYTLDLMGHQRYDVAPDGRFLMVENSEDFRVVVVEGFFEELRRLVPTD
ncbi:MAG: protein kinase [Gemmatimonadetes bacterium]|nr:protein kinase [Gemmatimonadota bacterium]